jgi:D-alanyl-D-alanine carboxypeptidase
MPVTRTSTSSIRITWILLATIITMLALALPSAAQAGRLAWVTVDAKTGQILSESNARNPRHPASLTKMMTAYMLFDALDAGRISMSTPLKVSSHAASEPASKLWLKAGSTITVRDALNALIIKSANDVATVVAENLAGSEGAFARQMTEAARQIGMRDTSFRNAHGLHSSAQVTTAYDMYLLALALQDRFPQYYPLFAQKSFRWKGQTINHHNPFLGHWRGVDGLKTGYTQASGYNLVTNIKRDGRHIIGVVIGADSSSIRNTKMGEILTHALPRASTGARYRARLDMDVKVDTKFAAAVRNASTAPLKSVRPQARRTPDPAAIARIAELQPQQKPFALAEEEVIFARDPEILRMMLEDLEREKRIEVARIEIVDRNRMAFLESVDFESNRLKYAPLSESKAAPPLPDVEIPTVAMNVHLREEEYQPLKCLEAGTCFISGVEKKQNGHYEVSDMSLFALITKADH